jgi:hypothetical protein
MTTTDVRTGANTAAHNANGTARDRIRSAAAHNGWQR